jgi:type IV pilus assembly protein PilK
VRGAVEWSYLVDRLTVQETRFFRHPASYDCVTAHLRQRLQRPAAGQAWQLWSVGCSSGEEAYSLAILASEQLIDAGLSPSLFGVTGTDLSLEALARARSGCYSPFRVGELDERRMASFHALEDGRLQVSQSLRDRTCFTRLNVLDLARAPQRGMDVIFCQNLLIYFRRWRRRDILSRLAERLLPGGMLVIGVGEMADWSHPLLEQLEDDRVLAFTRKG